jgi:hypothetical protein
MRDTLCWDYRPYCRQNENKWHEIFQMNIQDTVLTGDMYQIQIDYSCMNFKKIQGHEGC